MKREDKREVKTLPNALTDNSFLEERFQWWMKITTRRLWARRWKTSMMWAHDRQDTRPVPVEKPEKQENCWHYGFFPVETSYLVLDFLKIKILEKVRISIMYCTIKKRLTVCHIFFFLQVDLTNYALTNRNLNRKESKRYKLWINSVPSLQILLP